MTPAPRWAAMRAIQFNVSVDSDGQSHKTASTNHNLFEEPARERRAEAVSNRGPSAYQPNALPLGQTSSQVVATGPDQRFYTWS